MKKFGLENIVIYWWNHGSKTLDHNGTIADYLHKRSFKVSLIKHKTTKEIRGFRFKFEVSSRSVVYNVFALEYDYPRVAIEAISMFLILMGDKCTIAPPYSGYLRKINWR